LNRYHSYINSAKNVLSVYNGDEPLSSFLKKYFSANKKYGSKDRKQIAHLVYCFFRLGKVVMNISIEEKILTALFVCSTESNEILTALKPEWNSQVEQPLAEKLLIINYSLLIQNVFPWKDELSEGVDHEKLCESFLTQPDLFLRLRPGKEKIVIQKLKQAGINFKMISETCLALLNASKIDEIIAADNEAVIQDCNSQRTGGFLGSALATPRNDKLTVWDCCAGSGGKSIMVHDINPTIELTVSDKRENILANLKKRFDSAGIKNYKSIIADLADPNFQFSTSNFQLVIADVPCTGSGTWSRTPEQLYFFQEKEIEKYSTLQKKIVSNAIPQLKPGGTFVYITCSVFKKENEEVVMYLKQNFHLNLKQTEVLKGYDKKADSMFIAVFEKPL
jgi:16S rRNA (cytosine967-C5)-methyltransferase